jgi:hypothetical protein
MIHTFKENVKSNWAAQSTAMGGGSGNSIVSNYYYDSKLYDMIVCEVPYTGISSGASLVLTASQASDSTGGGSKSISGASTSHLSTNTTNTGVLIVQVRPWDLDSTAGFQYVGFKLLDADEDGAAITSMTVHQLIPRYAQATLSADR